MLSSFFWLSYADFTAFLRFSSLVLSLDFVYSCSNGLRLGGACAGGGGGSMPVGDVRFLAAPGIAPRKTVGSLWEGEGGWGG